MNKVHAVIYHLCFLVLSLYSSIQSPAILKSFYPLQKLAERCCIWAQGSSQRKARATQRIKLPNKKMCL